MVAAIAQWFRLRLPSCGPRFEFQAHHLCFFKKIEKNNFLIYQFTVGLYLFLKLRTKVDEVWNLHTREQVYLCDITHSVSMWHNIYVDEVWNLHTREQVYLCDNCVTRFGKILQLCLAILEGLFGTILILLKQNFKAIWTHFHCF